MLDKIDGDLRDGKLKIIVQILVDACLFHSFMKGLARFPCRPKGWREGGFQEYFFHAVSRELSRQSYGAGNIVDDFFNDHPIASFGHDSDQGFGS